MKLPNPSVNKKFIIIAIIVVVLGGVGFWAFLFLSGTPKEEGAVISKKIAIPMAEPAKEVTPAPPPEEVKPKEAKIKPEAPKTMVKPSVKKEEAFESEEEEAPSVKKAERKTYKPWAINLASFKSKKEANEFRNSLSQKGYNAYITEFVKNGSEWHRVRVGFYETEAKANKVADELSEKFSIGAPWVVKPSRSEAEKHPN